MSPVPGDSPGPPPTKADFDVQREEYIRTAIQAAESGDTEHLVAILSEPGPTPVALKNWLAAMFNPKANSEFVAKIQRRRAGKPPKGKGALAAAAQHIVANIDDQSKLESLVQQAIEKYSVAGHPISRTSIFDFLKSRWPALAPRFRDAKTTRKARKAKA